VKRFINMTLRPVLIVGGLGTSAALIYAFAPQFAVANIAQIEFIQEYTIFVQHWGIMVGLIGVMMVVAAFKPAWVFPIMIYAALEKAFMVYLVMSSVSESYSVGFWVPATMDAIIVLYSLLYFWSLYQERSEVDSGDTT
jgi:hypothetical protein